MLAIQYQVWMGAINDTTLRLINNNYEYILWTILAISIIIIAISLSRK